MAIQKHTQFLVMEDLLPTKSVINTVYFCIVVHTLMYIMFMF